MLLELEKRKQERVILTTARSLGRVLPRRELKTRRRPQGPPTSRQRYLQTRKDEEDALAEKEAVAAGRRLRRRAAVAAEETTKMMYRNPFPGLFPPPRWGRSAALVVERAAQARGQGGVFKLQLGEEIRKGRKTTYKELEAIPP